MINQNNGDKPSDDSRLLAEFVSTKDERAFRELLRRYERLVWSVCGRVLRNSCDVEDAFQTTFMLLATKAHRIRTPASLASWLHGVAWKTATRLRKNRATESLQNETDLTAAAAQPFDLIARQHEIELVDQQLRALSENYRIPLVLYYFNGLSIRRIAKELGITVSAAEGRLRRGRAKLKLELSTRGLLWSPAILLTLLVPRPPSNCEFVAETSERCVAAMSGASPGLPSATSISGTRLMMIKSCAACAATLLLAAGSATHLGSLQKAAAPAEQVTLPQESAHSGHFTTSPAKIMRQSKLKAGESQDDTSVRPREQLHRHLMHIHNHVHSHLLNAFRHLHGLHSQGQ